MPASFRNQKVDNPTRANGAEAPVITRDRQKPRFYGKKKTVLDSYHKNKGVFFEARAKARKIQAENAQIKWELLISKLLG